MQDKSTQKPTQ